MKDSELYAQLLGLQAPWQVAHVVLDVATQEVCVYVEAPVGARLCCAACDQPAATYDHREERRWRHLDSCGFTTWLIARVPRLSCPRCGVQTAGVPWSEPHSRFTLAFECFALRVLQATVVQAQAAGLLRLSAAQVHELMERAVARGLARRARDWEAEAAATAATAATEPGATAATAATAATEPGAGLPYVCVDEKSLKRGHCYVSILSDPGAGRVLEVVAGRTQEAACTLLEEGLSAAQRPGVQAVAMDMWGPFMTAREIVLPDAQTVHDRFHIARYLAEAVDQTRRAEHRQLQQEAKAKEGSPDKEGSPAKPASSPLTGTKYVWLKNPDKLSATQRAVLERLCAGELATAQVWGFKETFRDFFGLASVQQGEAFLDLWCQGALALNNRPLSKVVEMLQTHRAGLLAYLRHRISNAAAEGLNSRIQHLKAAARGFRRPANFRLAILFFLGKLDLYPQPFS